MNTNVTKGQVMPTNRSNTLERPGVKKPPTPKQIQLVKAKIENELKGIPQRQWAPKWYPNATPKAAEVSVSRELKKANVNDLLQEALEKHKLTPNAVVKVVASGMRARRVTGETNVYDTDGTLLKVKDRTAVDHNTRLKAAGMAARFMGIGNDPTEGGIHFHQHVGEKKQSYDD